MWHSTIRKGSKFMSLCENTIYSYHCHYIIIIKRPLFCVCHFCPSVCFHWTQLKSHSLEQSRNSPSFSVVPVCLLTVGAEGYCCVRSHSKTHIQSVGLLSMRDQPVGRDIYLTTHNTRRRLTSIHPARYEPPPATTSERRHTHTFRPRGHGNR
jgi:hypothetical protein